MKLYRDLVAQPRQPHRAKAHMIPGLNIADLKRGDFIFVESELGDRNNGKYMFDGQKIIGLSRYPDDYGSIPEEFQIGKFPPLYWKDLIDHNSDVPFDVARNLPNLTISNVKTLPRADGEGVNMYIPFQSYVGVLAIMDPEPMNPEKSPEVNAQEFLQKIANQRYFEFFNDDNYQGSDPSFPEGYSYENFIFYTYPA